MYIHVIKIWYVVCHNLIPYGLEYKMLLLIVVIY
jgi:hypothetical protein